MNKGDGTTPHLDQARGTGRTTRFLQRMVDHARLGNKVYIVTVPAQTRPLEKELADAAQDAGCAWVLNSNMRVISSGHSGLAEFRPGRYRFRTADPDDLVVADHHLLETHYGPAIDAWIEATK